ncbi:MAG: hypothetical protein K2P92_01950, partial [Bdellovibrionaceae bacterium]|nr:hypothetical protein [Pseudobdellovibrionaceae bacterium]
MRTLISIYFLLFATTASASVVRLDLGEDYILKIKRWSPLSKVWIEKKEVLQFEQNGSHLVFKAVRTGTSYLRIGQDLRQITVSSVGTKPAFKIFSELSSESADLSLNYCREALCLNGSIKSFDEYLKIRTLIKKL